MMSAGPSWGFSLFGFPVRVNFTFFLIALLLGFNTRDLFLLLIWVAVVFFSVLVHELGHAVTARNYGRDPVIQLYGMGGLTISTRYSMLSYPQEILLSFSGPLAGFLMGGLVFLLSRVAGPIYNPYVGYLLSTLLWVNIGWGIINLIPILPLDGGAIMRSLYHWLRSPYDERTPLKISIGFGVLAMIISLALAIRGGGVYLLILAAWLTFNNYQELTRRY